MYPKRKDSDFRICKSSTFFKLESQVGTPASFKT